jgi:hypothetical protein
LGYVQPPDIHHQLSGGRRKADAATIPLCPYHHRGVWNDRFTHLRLASTLLGPSLALEPKRFREQFGTDEELATQVEKYFEGRRVKP